MRSEGSLSRRIGVGAVAFVLLGSVAVFLALTSRLGSWMVPLEASRTREATAGAAALLQEHIGVARRDVLLLRASPIEAMLSSHPSPERLQGERIFAAMMVLNSAYAQLRIIDAEGRERFRIDRVGAKSPPRSTPEAELQDKSHRDYVEAGLATPVGSVFVSKLELNREHGQVTRPHLPVLRVATPVEVDAGLALIVINIDMRPVLDQIRDRGGPQHDMVVFDRRGGLLVHPNPDREFGIDLGHHHRVSSSFPGLRWPVAAAESITLHDSDTTAAVRVVELGSGAEVAVAAVSTSGVSNAIRDALLSVLWPATLATLLAAAFALLGARSLARPLGAMAEAAGQIAEGETPTIPTNAPGEVGILARALTSMRDTIDARTAKLAAERSRFIQVIEANPRGVLVVDVDDTVALTNGRATALLSGRDPCREEFAALFTAESRPRVQAAVRLARLREPQSLESHLTTADGSLPVEVELTSMDGDEGGLVLASLADLAEQRRTQRAFERLIEAAPNATVVVDENGEIQLVNRATERLFGYPRDELIGQPIHMLVPEDERDVHRAHLRRFVGASMARPMAGRDVRGRRKDGKMVPVEVGLSPVEQAQGMSFIASVTDVSERKAQEMDLRRSNAELERFAYVASHDLKEPLRMVVSFTELLEARAADKLDGDDLRYLSFAAEGARRMQRMVTNLLDYARIGEHGAPFATVDTSALVNLVWHNLGHRVQESGAQLEVTGSLPTVWGDEVQLERLFQNLLVNAIKFRSERPLQIRVACEPEGDRWRYSIADNGVGISPRHVDRIFGIFQSLNARDDGDGIGLAVAQRIVERHDGHITVVSEPGVGSDFQFTLPSVPLEDGP